MSFWQIIPQKKDQDEVKKDKDLYSLVSGRIKGIKEEKCALKLHTNKNIGDSG